MAFSQLACHVAMDDSYEAATHSKTGTATDAAADDRALDSTMSRQPDKASSGGDDKDLAVSSERQEQQRPAWREGREQYGRDVLFHSGGEHSLAG